MGSIHLVKNSHIKNIQAENLLSYYLLALLFIASKWRAKHMKTRRLGNRFKVSCLTVWHLHKSTGQSKNGGSTTATPSIWTVGEIQMPKYVLSYTTASVQTDDKCQ